MESMMAIPFNRYFDTFQLVMLVLFLVTFYGRTLYLRVVKGINPIALGGQKGGLRLLVELAFPVWLVLWIVEVLWAALHLNFHILLPFLDTRLFGWLPLQITGVLLNLFGYGLFVASLISFGDSWRVGVDEKQPGALVTTGVYTISRNPIFVF